MTDRSPIRADELEAHVLWVRSLAGRLVADPHRADDLSQRALTAALTSRRREGGSLRAWLAAVLRNFARMDRRGDARREEREAVAAHRETSASPDDLVARAAAHREVIDALLRVGEPDRSLLLMRFFEGAPPRELAKRMRLAPRTVHERVERALESLRRELDRGRGGRRTEWMAALAPIIPAKTIIGPIAAGAVVVKSKIAAGVVLACAAVLIFLYPWSAPAGSASPGAESAPSGAPRDTAAPLAAIPAAVDTSASRRRDAAERSAAASRTAPASSPTASVAERTLRGRVVDTESRAVAGIRIVLKGTNLHFTADDDGRFDVRVHGESGELKAESDLYETVFSGVLPSYGETAQPVVIVAPQVAYGGFVRSDRREAVAGARIRLALPTEFRARFQAILDFSKEVEREMYSDADGSFDWKHVPQIPGASIAVSRGGFEPFSTAAPPAPRFDLEFILTSTRFSAGSLSGVVFEADGRPAAGASVAAGGDVATTGDDGRFTLAMRGEAAAEVWAAKLGALPASADVQSRRENNQVLWPTNVELRLGPAPQPIEGRVMLDDGTPAARAQVWLRDAQWLGRREGHPIVVESWIGGMPTAPLVTADALGNFRIPASLAKSYRVEALDPETLCLGEAQLDAGTRSCIITIARSALRPKVSGRVTNRRGDPVPGVLVQLHRDTFSIAMPPAGSYRHGQPLGPIATDADGKFTFDRAAAGAGMNLSFDAPQIYRTERGLPDAGAVENMEVTVLMRCHFRVELPDTPDGPTRFQVLGENGKPLDIAKISGDTTWSTTQEPLSRGRSDVVTVDETAAKIVFLRDGLEVRTLPLRLKPGEIGVVRY